MNDAIHQTNDYPVDTAVSFAYTYPLDVYLSGS